MHIDVIIIGGGIAGLWTLASLRKQGYSVVLIESGAIGGVQSIASQGIIHGGTKYALGGRLGDSAKIIGNMPAIWNDCLSGRGEVDLTDVEVHTKTQFMWSTQSAISKIAGFFAGKLMQDRMRQLQRSEFPIAFNDAGFAGVMYQLNEPVINTASLMAAFYKQQSRYFLQCDVQLDKNQPLTVQCQDSASGRILQITARQLVLTAGAGNSALLQQLQRVQPQMQKRPVHMTMLKGDMPMIYAHCLGASASARVTITSTCVNDETVWYVGGEIAETGVRRNREQQILACKQELEAVLPWLDFTHVQWATLMLDRAEIKTPAGKRPDNSFATADAGVITVWPTKLAFAPRVAQQVSSLLQDLSIAPSNEAVEMPEWPRPVLADWPWRQIRWSR